MHQLTSVNLKYEQSVTLVGAASPSKELLAEALAVAPILVAADGGADVAAGHNYTPKAIIGDMDSVVNLDFWQNSGIHILRIEEQDTTDFQKCLRAVEAPAIIGVGFLGRRNDHALAALSTLIAEAGRPVVLLDETDVVVHCPRDVSLDLEPGTRLSLFPLRPVTGTRSEGLRWPVTGLRFAPGGMTGTSNEVTGPVRIGFDGDGMLLIVPRRFLTAVLDAIRG